MMPDYGQLPELLRSRPVSDWPGATWTLGDREDAMTEERKITIEETPAEPEKVEVTIETPEPDEDADPNDGNEKKEDE